LPYEDFATALPWERERKTLEFSGTRRKMSQNMMKRALIIGSVICCFPGLWILAGAIIDFVEYWDYSLRGLVGYEHDALWILVYASLSCIPAGILVKARHTEISRVKSAIIGVMELALIVPLWLVFFNFGM
jgi:hypothetical protein